MKENVDYRVTNNLKKQDEMLFEMLPFVFWGREIHEER